MPKTEEKDKAKDRGQTLTASEEALEDARDAFHAHKDDPSAKEAFKAAQQAVVTERVASREGREAAGPPADALDVVRDAAGKAVGWRSPGGDLTVNPGGVA